MAIPIAAVARLVFVMHILMQENLPTLDHVIVNGSSVNYSALRHVERTLIQTSRMHILAILRQTMAGNFSLLERHERTIGRIVESYNDPRCALRQWPEWRFRITQSKKPHRQETSRNSTEEGNAVVFDTEGALHLSHSSAPRSRRPQTRAAPQASQGVPPLPVADDRRLRQYSSQSCAPRSRRPQTRTAPQANQSVPSLPVPDDKRLRQYSSRSSAPQSRRQRTRTPQPNRSVGHPLPEPDDKRSRQLSSQATFVPQPSTSFGNSPQELENHPREKPRRAPRCNTCGKNMQGLSLLDKGTWSKIREIIKKLDRLQIRDFVKEINKWDKKIFDSLQFNAIPDHEIVDALVKSLQRYHLSGQMCVLCCMNSVFRRIRRLDLANQIEEIQSRLN